MFNKLLPFSILSAVVFSPNAYALSDSEILSMIPPDDKVAPCVRNIDTREITRAVISMEPFRSVNFIFPFKLDDASTIYSLSSDKIWGYESAKGQKIVNVSFKSFNNSDWGKVNDFSISTHGYIFSFTLKAEPGKHCSNVVFTLSEEEKKRIEEGEQKKYLEAIKADYNQKFADLNLLAEQKALNLVASLAQEEPDSTGIHEEDSLELSNGDSLQVFADEILGYGKFNILKLEVKNGSSSSPLYIKSINVYQLSESNKRGKEIPGAIDFDKKMEPDSSQSISYATQKALPTTGAVLVVSTTQGDIEVEW